MAPLKYLSFKDENGKRIARKRVFLSLFASVILSVVFLQFPKLNVFGVSGLIEKIGSFTSTLTGFYVAALVAVTTFGQGLPEMDGKMPSGRIYYSENGGPVDISRREYLTSLFGYLVLIAFVISILSIAIPLAGSAMALSNKSIVMVGFNIDIVRLSGFLMAIFYFWILGHLVAETSVGLDYLVDKLYRKHPKLVSGTLKTNGEAKDASSHPDK